MVGMDNMSNLESVDFHNQGKQGNLEKWYLLVERGPEGIVEIFGIYPSEEEAVNNAKRLINALSELQPLVEEVDALLDQESLWSGGGLLEEVFEEKVGAIRERLAADGIPLDYASLPRLQDIAVLVLVREGDSPFLRVLHERSFFASGSGA